MTTVAQVRANIRRLQGMKHKTRANKLSLAAYKAVLTMKLGKGPKKGKKHAKKTTSHKVQHRKVQHKRIIAKPKKSRVTVKKHKKGWGPGNALYDWQQKNKGKTPRKSKGKKKKGGFPPWLGKYYKLKGEHPGWSKKKLYAESGRPAD